jgi:hypothetical protein
VGAQPSRLRIFCTVANRKRTAILGQSCCPNQSYCDVRTLHQSIDLAGEIVALYRLTVPAAPERNLPARYNICPTQTIDTVIEREGKRELVPMRWGLIPSWWKKTAKETPSTFNARAETVAEKPMFRSAFKRNRCLIPASGYYEWQSTATGKQPYYYTAGNSSPLTIAGLWDEWKDTETGKPLKSSRNQIDGIDSSARHARCCRRGTQMTFGFPRPCGNGTQRSTMIRATLCVISVTRSSTLALGSRAPE